jgi:hypothetical protein
LAMCTLECGDLGNFFILKENYRTQDMKLKNVDNKLFIKNTF